MVRKSKRKPRKSFIDEDNPDENSNSTAETDLGEREGEEENGGQNCSGDKIGGGAQQGDVLLPRLQIEQEQIARRVNWGAKGDGRNMLMKPNMEERGESKAGEEEFNRSLNETMKFEVGEDTALNLEMSVMKKDAAEEKEPMPPLMEKNKVSTGAAALLGAVAKNSNPRCGCIEPFLEEEERCKANCANRNARRECNCVPPCSNMAVQMLRQGKTAALVKEVADRLVTKSSVPDQALLGELTGEILTKEEMSIRLEEYKAAGKYSRVWKLGPDLRMDTEPLQRPGSAFRVAKHSCMPSAAVKEWEVDGIPCLIVVATRPLAENEEIYLDLGYQLEVIGATKFCDCGTPGCRLLLGASVQTFCNSRCCSCQAGLPPGNVPLHPTLGLQSCADCRQRLLAIDWEEKSMCRCCGSDKQAALFPCSNCPSFFCKPCLAQSLGKPRLTQGWRCLLCCSAPMRNFKLGLVKVKGQESVDAAGGTTFRNEASPGPVSVVRASGPKVALARGRASPRGAVSLGLRQNIVRPGEMSPRMMPGMRLRMIGTRGMRPRVMVSPDMVGPRRMCTPSSVRPRTPINRPVVARVTGPRPGYPISPRQNLMSDQTTEELNHLSVDPAASVPNDWEDPASDPLAEDSTPSLTYQDEPANMNTSGAFNDVNQNSGRMVKSATMPPAIKRPRIVVGGQSRSSLGPRMPPGPRMWKSPGPSPLLPARPLCRVVSQPFQIQAAEVEVVDVEEEEKNNMEVVLRKIPSTVTLIRTNEVSLEREARQIVEVMSRVANKLSDGGGDNRMVSRDVLEAKKMLSGMATRLGL